jgi:hypothetical protein
VATVTVENPVAEPMEVRAARCEGRGVATSIISVDDGALS